MKGSFADNCNLFASYKEEIRKKITDNTDAEMGS